MQWDALWINGTIATCESNGKPYGLIEEGAIGVKDGKIVWIGRRKDLPKTQDATHIFDVAGACITPGFIDCHTHLVFAGNRAHEFELRMQGTTYEMILQQGGGIHSTVRATREISEEELFQQSLQRARAMQASGVTTIEIKSGYGLDLETELKILRVAKRIEETLSLTVVKTFLGAHTVPLEYQQRADDYVDYVCDIVLPRVVELQLADAVDVFCETIGFSRVQTERVFKTAEKYGLKIKCHAEQLSDLGASLLAAQYKALSVDHLEFLSEKAVSALAKAGTVAVLLPGAFYFLREKKAPPVAWLREQGVPMAIATDCNPGTSPVTSLLLMLNMACVLFQLTPEEALLGVTRHAARALGLEAQLGTLAVGKNADLVVWNATHPIELTYFIGSIACLQCVKNGRVLS